MAGVGVTAAKTVTNLLNIPSVLGNVGSIDQQAKNILFAKCIKIIIYRVADVEHISMKYANMK